MSGGKKCPKTGQICTHRCTNVCQINDGFYQNRKLNEDDNSLFDVAVTAAVVENLFDSNDSSSSSSSSSDNDSFSGGGGDFSGGGSDSSW